MRGKALPSMPPRPRSGITPAYAGKSYAGAPKKQPKKDHPRVCGEKGLYWSHGSLHTGSPPRMRGKGRCQARPRRHLRITPAYAGKSSTSGGGGTSTTDHPRVCGEKSLIYLGRQGENGSPPRMRGKGWRTATPSCMRGITPAYAGKSVLQPARGPQTRDHPRVCGEKSFMGFSDFLIAGSPPRMRGKGV